MSSLNDKYNPKDFEDEIYANWLKKEYFKPSRDKSKKPYSIVMPPPNVTGKLHMGHALDNTLQDILIRYKRMSGYDTLWIPGTDHASIATEVKVVDKLKKEGKTKQDVGRDGFLEETWAWTKQYGGTIISQLKKIGVSCDWDRERFTLDEGLSKAVRKVFIDLYNKDLIYKGKKMINWCSSCKTSISDAEVEYEEEDTKLWHIKYTSKNGKTSVIVATTRPETMLGDTAVAVNPNDERYLNLIGTTVILPIINKEIPIIADEFVDKEFGTGCVKITPAHDTNDYEAGLRHNLAVVEVLDDEGKIKNKFTKYSGMTAIKAREAIIKDLEDLGVLVKTEDYHHSVGKCYRCHQKIEPKISEQWFVKMEGLAKKAIEAVKNGEVRFVPSKYDKTYYHWMENTRDWCISRQLWWGHRIPAYMCEDCGEIIVAENPEKCTKCGKHNLKQDEDTLDTWFSSALWPFSTLGWPDKSEDIERFYPTNTLVTGYDIITFWVSRMIVSGLEHMEQVPFKDILIHGLVRDIKGRKMSKSLGNGIDPMDIIEEYGADALRFSLILNTTPGNDLRYMPEKLETASNFANKIWNASKFVLMNIEKLKAEGGKLSEKIIRSDTLKDEDRWILSKLNTLAKEVNINLDNYDIGVALDKIYGFIWDEFCDWYIEIVKPRLYSDNIEDKAVAASILNYVLQQSLKILHPFMPFITEKIYRELPCSTETIMLAEYPVFVNSLEYKESYEFIEEIKNMITNIRNIRTNMNVHPSKKAKMIIVLNSKNGGSTELENSIKNSKEFIKKLGFGSDIKVQDSKEGISDNALSIIQKDFVLYMPFEDLVDIEVEKERLQEEKKKLEIEVLRGEKMLSNEGFIAKAPQTKIKEEKQKLEKYKQMLKSVEDRLVNM